MDIKSVIKKYGENTYTIAEKMGITQPSVMQYINGNPTARKLEEIARAIGCSPAEFFNDWKGNEQQGMNEVQTAIGRQEQKSESEQLPFSEECHNQQTLMPAAAILCPHCGKAITLGVVKS